MDEIHGDGIGPALGGKGAPCPTVTFCKVTWKIGWPTEEARLWLELLIAQYAEDGLKERKRTKSAVDYAKSEADLERDLAAGYHRTFGQLWNKTVDGPDGMPLCLLSLLKEHQPDATLKDAKVLWGSAARQVRIALAQVVPNFAAVLVEDNPLIHQDEREAKKAELTALFLERIAPPPTPTTEKPKTSEPDASA